MDLQLTKYLALKMELVSRLTVYDQWLYTIAGQMGREFGSLVANSAECMEGSQKILNAELELHKGFGNLGRKPDAVKAKGPYCDKVYMRARDADRPPSEQVLFEARLGKWTSHHGAFFSKLRTLKEVKACVLQQWWKTYMLCCKYILRGVIATMRRKLAVESGSMYGPVQPMPLPLPSLSPSPHRTLSVCPNVLQVLFSSSRRVPQLLANCSHHSKRRMGETDWRSVSFASFQHSRKSDAAKCLAQEVRPGQEDNATDRMLGEIFQRGVGGIMCR